MEELTEERRKAIAKSIRPISIEELKTLGEQLFPLIDHPWREKFFGFIAANPGATFHHAIAHDGVQIIYCHAQEKGMWFLPGTGMALRLPIAAQAALIALLHIRQRPVEPQNALVNKASFVPFALLLVPLRLQAKDFARDGIDACPSLGGNEQEPRQQKQYAPRCAHRCRHERTSLYKVGETRSTIKNAGQPVK
jgi:hypothetical protein